MKKSFLIVFLIMMLLNFNIKSYASTTRVDFTSTIYGELDDNNNLVIYGHGDITQNQLESKSEFLNAETITFRGDNNKIVFPFTSIIFGETKASKIVIDTNSNVDTSKVTDMSGMFRGCKSLTTLNVSNFDTSKVTNMACMFDDCKSLTNLDVSGFNTSKVTNMHSMFSDCKLLTKLDLSNFDTSNVTNMEGMFCYCESLTNLNVSNFDTSKVTNMDGMFNDCKLLTNLNVSNFDTSNVTDMRSMFAGCESLIDLNVSNFDTSNVTDIGFMFFNCKSLTKLDLSNFDTSKVTDMDTMFEMCHSLTDLNISGFDTSNVTDMGWMFYECKLLTKLDLSNFDTSNVTDMTMMFYDCESLQSLDIRNFDTSNVISMIDMFFNCRMLTKLDLSSFDISKVLYMTSMFEGCTSLIDLNISTFDTSNVLYMNKMFYGCKKIKTLDLTDILSSNVLLREHGINPPTLMLQFDEYIAAECDLLDTIYIGDTYKFKDKSGLFFVQQQTPTIVVTTNQDAKNYDWFADNRIVTFMTPDEYKNINNPVTPVEPEKVTLKSISASKDVSSYYIGEKIDTDDITVTATYSDGSTKKITNFTTNVNSIDINKEGKYDLYVTYKEDGTTCASKIVITLIDNTKKDVVLITYKSYDKNGIEYIVPRNLLNMGSKEDNPQEIEIKNKKMTEALSKVKVGEKISRDIVNKQNQGGQYKGEITSDGYHANSKWTKVDIKNNYYEGIIYLTDTKLGKDSIVVTLYHKDATTKKVLDKKDLNFGNSRENPERLTIKYTDLPTNFRDEIKLNTKIYSSILNKQTRLGKYTTNIDTSYYLNSEWTKVDNDLEEYEAVIYWSLNDNTSKAVTQLVTNTSYMTGYEDNTFKPSNNITREETAAILSRLCENFSTYNLNNKKNDFNDVTSGSWSEKNIAYISDLGIMLGDGENFNKKSYITRGEFVTAIVRLLGLENTVPTKEFSDAKGTWYSNNANILLSLGIISGDENGNFNGKNNITRAEICKIINNVLGKSINPNELQTKKNNNKLKDIDSNAWYYNDVLMATQSE